MASSGEVFGALSGRPRFRLRAAIAVAQIDEALNRARWDWNLRVENLDGSSITWDGAIGNASMQVNGSYVFDGRTPAGTFDFRDGAAFHVIASGTTGWFEYNTDGNKTIGFAGGVANAGLFGAANASGAIAADRINHPAHTGLTATRNSDNQISLIWTRNGVYSGAVVHRRMNDGAWQQVGTPGGNANAFTDTTTVANRKYEYRVIGRAGNALSVGWSNVASVYTTPVAPTGISASRQGSGIVVNASGKPPYATSYDVRDGATQIATAVALPWIHANPNAAVPHTYQVRARVGGLIGPWSTSSNTVQLLTPPNAPAGLAPNGAVVPDDQDVTFRWTHNPVDSSDQSAYELRYRLNGGAWTTLSGTTASERAVTLGVGAIEWQVRTKGTHPDFGAWSSVAAFSVVSRPGVAIVQPDTSWDASTLPVEWTYFQPQDRPQSAWQVQLLNADDEIVETRSGSGAATTVTLTRRLTEGHWTVNVQAATGDVWSDWASSSFDVVFDPPATPSITAEWDEEQGGVSLTVTVGEDGDAPATVEILIERSVDGAETWEQVAVVAADANLVDWESLTFGITAYRATAFTSEGAASIAQAEANARSGALWLSGGAGFGVTARLPFDPAVTITAERERTLKQYAGRSLPVAYTGEARSRVVAVSGRTTDRDPDTADVDTLTRVAQAEQDDFLFRDPDGRRIYGSIGGIPMPRQSSTLHPDGWEAWWGYSFTLTETERR